MNSIHPTIKGNHQFALVYIEKLNSSHNHRSIVWPVFFNYVHLNLNMNIVQLIFQNTSQRNHRFAKIEMKRGITPT